MPCTEALPFAKNYYPCLRCVKYANDVKLEDYYIVSYSGQSVKDCPAFSISSRNQIIDMPWSTITPTSPQHNYDSLIHRVTQTHRGSG